jgi:type VI secretion system secreted protein Hcp
MAFDAYLKIEGVDGEVQSKGMEKTTEIYSFSFGASNPTSVKSSGGAGLSAGKVELSSFNFMKKLDKTSSVLFQACCTGKHFPKATLSLRKAGGDAGQAVFLEYLLTQVFVDSVQWSGSTGGDDTPTESVSFNFAKIELTYSTIDDKGKAAKAGQAGWDLVKLSAK